MAILFFAIFLLCDNIKNVFAILFFVPFFIDDIGKNPNWVIYFICIGVGVGSIVYFLIKQLCINKKQVKKGQMFWPIIFATVAFVLGGIARFNIVIALITFGLCFATYALYFFALNFTKDLKNYLSYIFIIGGFLISLEILILNFKTGNFMNSLATRQVFWIGAESANTAAIYLLLSAISCVASGYKTQRDYLYFLLSIFFDVMIVLTFCRTVMLFTAIIMLVLYILTIIKSPNKKQFAWIIGAIVIVAGVGCVVFFDQVKTLVSAVFGKNILDGNGRSELWPWCVEKFKQYPIFGYGFVADEVPPSLRAIDPQLVLAHNTPLQWLTSLGIFGSLLMIVFYYGKYKLIFKDYNKKHFCITAMLLAIELSGLLDQAATMETFMFIIPFILISAIEQDKPTLRFTPKFLIKKKSL